MPAINYGAALGDAASSAAAGMMFGLPGGGLIGFAFDLVPGLLPHLFGKLHPDAGRGQRCLCRRDRW